MFNLDLVGESKRVTLVFPFEQANVERVPFPVTSDLHDDLASESHRYAAVAANSRTSTSTPDFTAASALSRSWRLISALT
jgi:hypothetical protein